MKTIFGKVTAKDIVIDEELYPRNGLWWQQAYDYSEAMKTGAQFPPIVVAKSRKALILVDGRHRLEALKILYGRKKFAKLQVKCEVLMFLDKSKIYEEAIRRNVTHGLRFSIQERLKIAEKLKVMNYTTEKISKIIQVPLQKLKQLQTARVIHAISGEPIVLKKTVEHLSKKERVPKDIEFIQEDMKGQSQLELIRELVVLIKTKTLDLKNKKIKLALKALKQALRGM